MKLNARMNVEKVAVMLLLQVYGSFLQPRPKRLIE